MVAPLVCYLLGIHPPAVRDLGRALVVARHTLRAHGAMYRALRAVLPASAPIGVVHNMMHLEALDPTNAAERAEAERRDYFLNQWYLDGITTGRINPPAG